MTKYHINAKGDPAPCKARKGNCPFGGEDGNENHFDTMEEAQKYANEINEAKYSLLPSSELRLSPAASEKLSTQVVVMNGEIDKDKFTLPRGNLGINKPLSGGFWTSSQNEDGESGWTKWARSERFYADIDDHEGYGVSNVAIVSISPDANVLTIDNKEDYEKVISRYKQTDDNEDYNFSVTMFGPEELIDFEKLQEDYDGLRVTEKGLKENKDEFEHWSCESTLWFNLDNFEDTEYIEKGYDESKSKLILPDKSKNKEYDLDNMNVGEHYDVVVGELGNGEREYERMSLSSIKNHNGHEVLVFDSAFGDSYVTYNHGEEINWELIEEVNSEFI